MKWVLLVLPVVLLVGSNVNAIRVAIEFPQEDAPHEEQEYGKFW